MTILEIEPKIKNNLLDVFRDLEKTLDNILMDTAKLAEEYYNTNINLEKIRVNAEIPSDIGEYIIEKYFLEFIDKENNIIATYKKIEIWIRGNYSPFQSEKDFKFDRKYSHLYPPPKEYLINLDSYLDNIATNGRRIVKHISSLTETENYRNKKVIEGHKIKKVTTNIKAISYIDKNAGPLKIVPIMDNKGIINGVIYHNNRTEIIIYL
ncbi:MAG: hypothetical protein RXQ77_03335 [Candidatus Nanopusillus sp.]